MPAVTHLEPAHHAPIVDGVVDCWRCGLPVELETGYCDGCGGVTIPEGEPSRPPATATSSTAAIRRQNAGVLAIDPLPSLNALDLLGSSSCEV